LAVVGPLASAWFVARSGLTAAAVGNEVAWLRRAGRSRLAAELEHGWQQLVAAAGELPPPVERSHPPPEVIVPPEPVPSEEQLRGVTMLLPRPNPRRAGR
jgi:hypothetical protein